MNEGSGFQSNPVTLTEMRQKFIDREKQLVEFRKRIVAWLNHLRSQVDPNVEPLEAVPTDMMATTQQADNILTEL